MFIIVREEENVLERVEVNMGVGVDVFLSFGEWVFIHM